MAQTKRVSQMETQVAETETKEVAFSDMELKIKKPVLGKDGSMEVGGNFEELAGQISSVVAKYKCTVLTEDNVNYVKALKIQFQKLRTGIETKRKDWKKIYITTPSKLLDAMCDDLQKIVAEGEDALGTQLDAYDQKRKDELTQVLEAYREDSAKAHNLREEYASRIELKEKYYNKTQKEEDSADDIEAQATELEKQQTAFDAGVKLIRSECEEAGMLAETYIRELEYKSAMEIILEIKEDKKYHDELKAKQEAGEKIVVGEPVEDAQKLFGTNQTEDDGFDEVKVRRIELTYKASLTSAVSSLFTQLKGLGVDYKFIR